MQDVIARLTERRVRRPLGAVSAFALLQFLELRPRLVEGDIAGPRYFDQRSDAGDRFEDTGAPVPLVYFMSSVNHSGRASGVPTVAVRVGAFDSVATGPCVVFPVCSKRITGGVLPTAISVNGDIT